VAFKTKDPYLSLDNCSVAYLGLSSDKSRTEKYTSILCRCWGGLPPY